LKIAELTALHIRIPLRKKIRHASYTRSTTDNIVVRCVLDNKVEGYGEGVPREYVTGENIEADFELLLESDLSAQLEPCRDFDQALAVAERMQLARSPDDERHCLGNAARCAVELAVLDAYGRHYGSPLSEITKRLTPACYQPKERVRYSGAITSANTPFKVRLASFRLWVWGFHDIKIKVGMEGHDDVARCKNVRRRLGWKRDLRADANEAWSPDDCVERIRGLEPYALAAIEQPIAHEHAGKLPGIRKQVKTPIMLDESLCSMIDAQRAATEQSCDLFNIRLSKCGGFIPSLRLVEFARRHGIGYQLGCQVGESALLSAAGRHFAVSVADIRWLEGSYDKHLVLETLGKRDITFGWGGWGPALTGPGLGIDADPQALERVTVRKVALI
jgi:muconate cycloisomerase